MSMGGKKERILVVDDEPLICGMFESVLTSEHCLPTTCTDPQEAVGLCDKSPFAIAFIDINMPGMNGLEFASLLKARNPECEVVFMTGYSTVENAIEAIKLGACDYLRKPFSVSEIVFCLSRFQERKALKERISLAEQRYFQLVQNIPMMIFVLRKDFRINFVNQACASILGYEPEEVIDVPDWLLTRTYSDDLERMKDLFLSSFESGGLPFSAECRLLHKKDYVINTIVKSIGRPSFDVDPESECLEGIIVDITDRVFLEKALVQREKVKTLGVIAAEVAHEIRNPLVAIGGFARRLQKKTPESTEVGIILRECQRLEKILDRIKNYLKPVQIHNQECSVNGILKDCVELLSPEIQLRRVRCSLDLNSSVPSIVVDPDVLSQVFINLIRNALAAMSKGGNLLIKTFESDQNLHIDFENEVNGLTLKKPELLFLPFDEGGQSIGLPLSYRLVRNMGGLLSFVERQDRIVFTVSLPKTTQPQ